MKKIFNRGVWSLPILALGLAFITPSSVFALPAAGIPQQPQETNAQQTAAPQDPITQLNLSPEQRQQIRSIREQNKEERATINRRLRETQLALDEALNAASPDDALIEQRAREAGEARAAAFRLRTLTETKIRRVLTPEQIITLRQLQIQAHKAIREQRQENRANQGKGPAGNGRALPNQRNGLGLGPRMRRNALPRKPKA